MNDSSLRDKAKPITVLVYESVTGGGLAGHEFPESWAREGSAMRRAIAKDFASIPGVRVLMTLDSRLPIEEIPRVETRLLADPGRASLLEIVAEADYTALIAPETDGILYGLTDCLERAGARSLGSSRRAVILVGDKGRLAHHFLGHEIPSPRTRILGRSDRRLPDWPGPIVVKPRVGAGSVDTVIVRDGLCPDWAIKTGKAIAQPYLPGRPMSASFLVDSVGKMTLLGYGRQRIEIDPDGRISYRGGTILSGVPEAQELLERAISSVNDDVGLPGLRGFVGVDYLDDPKSGVTVLEINPRPTTSYVGLMERLGPGTIAGAWLSAIEGPLDATDWPDRIKAASQAPDISFLADGSILLREDAT